MKRDSDGVLVFTPTAEVRALCEPCPEFSVQPKKGFIAHTTHYRWGNLYTDEGNPVLGMRVVDGASDLFIDNNGNRDYSYYPFESLLQKLGMPVDEYDPRYNCMGYCFADSQYRIVDPTVILRDEYELSTKDDATVFISFRGNEAVHGALKKGETFWAKSGVLRFESFKSYEKALAGIPHDKIRFYRPKVS